MTPGEAPSAVPEERWLLPKLGMTIIRPLSFADRRAFRLFGARLTPDDLRLRFAGPIRMDASLCRRLLDIDHDREEAYAAFAEDGAMLGVGRIVRSAPDEAEIALIVRSDRKRRGLGAALMRRLIRHGKTLHLAALCGDVLTENYPARRLAKSFGFAFVGALGITHQIRLALASTPFDPEPRGPA
jgi:acetyltransferase